MRGHVASVSGSENILLYPLNKEGNMLTVTDYMRATDSDVSVVTPKQFEMNDRRPTYIFLLVQHDTHSITTNLLLSRYPMRLTTQIITSQIHSQLPELPASQAMIPFFCPRVISWISPVEVHDWPVVGGCNKLPCLKYVGNDGKLKWLRCLHS